jgi:hypothetical protein
MGGDLCMAATAAAAAAAVVVGGGGGGGTGEETRTETWTRLKQMCGQILWQVWACQ